MNNSGQCWFIFVWWIQRVTFKVIINFVIRVHSLWYNMFRQIDLICYIFDVFLDLQRVIDPLAWLRVELMFIFVGSFIIFQKYWRVNWMLVCFEIVKIGFINLILLQLVHLICNRRSFFAKCCYLIYHWLFKNKGHFILIWLWWVESPWFDRVEHFVYFQGTFLKLILITINMPIFDPQENIQMCIGCRCNHVLNWTLCSSFSNFVKKIASLHIWNLVII